MNQMLTKDNQYGIHSLTIQTNKYLLVAPINGRQNYDLFLLIPSNDFMNLSNDDIIKEISLVEENIKNQYPNQIIAIPIIDTNLLKIASTTNDTKPYLYIFNQIKTVTADIYRQINSANSTVSQTITFIKTNEENTKFIDFIELYINTSTPNAIKEINLTNLSKVNEEKPAIEPVINIEKPKTKVLAPKLPNKAGSANILLTTITLLLSLLVGISISYIIIK